MPLIPKDRWESAEEYIEFLTHWAGYTLFAGDFVSGREVLEIGCGYRYGSDKLSASAFSVISSDIVEEHISYCQNKYQRSNLVFAQANGLNLPFKDDSFDMVLSFQVIEHIRPRDVLDYLLEITRVLRSGGTFLASTPNARMRLLPFQRPWNPEHTKGYKDNELEGLLSRIFEEVEVYGLCSSSEEILALEYHGRRRTPFRAYVVPLVVPALSRLLSLAAFTWLKRLVQRLSRHQVGHKRVAQKSLLSRYSLSDFRIDRTRTRDCIGLYGVGTKVGS